MNTKTSINQIITALMELEAKGCHSVYFEYSEGLFRVRIYSGEYSIGKVVYEGAIYHEQEHAEMEKLSKMIETLKYRVTTTVFQCYKRVFVRGEKSGEWVKIKPIFECGENAMSSMLCDGSGYFVDDPANGLQYFVDMKKVSEL